MAYNKKTWLARLGQGLNKFIFNGGSKVTLDSAPDVVSQQGTPLSADNMNDLEQRIKSGFDDVDSAINAINTRVTNIEDTLMGENEVTVQYPSDSTYTSLMPNKVPTRALKFAEVPRFRGKSRAWNQYFNNTVNFGNITGTVSDYSITFTSSGTSGYVILRTESNKIPQGHKFVVLSNNSKALFQTWGSGYLDWTALSLSRIDGSLTTANFIGTCNGDINGILLNVNSITSGDLLKNIIIRDLTLIFGAGNEPSTVADALAQLPALGQYNAYDAGSLVDTEVSGVKSVGVNIWDEEWVVGGLNADGTINSSETSRRTSTFIPVISGEDYYLKCPSSAGSGRVAYYDHNKNMVSYNYSGLQSNQTFTINIGVSYVRITFGQGYGITYNHDIQISKINGSVSTLDTTYHPYKSDTLSLHETVTLRSAGSVADELDVESGVVTHKIYKKTFSASDGWELSGAGNFFLEISDMYQVDYTTQISLLAEYAYDNTNSSIDKTYWNNGRFIFVRDTSFNGDTSAFASALAGKKLNYALATPTTKSIDPVPYNFLEVEGGGTVETIQTQTPVIDNSLDVTYDIIPQ